jgi:predicted nuclease of restriction endonuclease-like (RecB) superfamily
VALLSCSKLALSFCSVPVGFTFVARQKRIAIDNEDYYIDLLFFFTASTAGSWR